MTLDSILGAHHGKNLSRLTLGRLVSKNGRQKLQVALAAAHDRDSIAFPHHYSLGSTDDLSIGLHCLEISQLHSRKAPPRLCPSPLFQLFDQWPAESSRNKPIKPSARIRLLLGWCSSDSPRPPPVKHPHLLGVENSQRSKIFRPAPMILADPKLGRAWSLGVDFGGGASSRSSLGESPGANLVTKQSNRCGALGRQ